MLHTKKNFLKSALAVFCMVFMLLFSSYSGITTVYAASGYEYVLLTKYSKTMKIGDEYYLTAITSTGKKPKFSSSDSAVASVNTYGKITAKKAGNATITAKIANGVASCRVTVEKTVITLSQKSISLENGYTDRLKAETSTGHPVTYKSARSSIASVDENGVISLKDLEEALSDQTILVSLMHVNNEIGAVEPVEEAAALVHEKCPKALVHVDAIQSYGKFRIYPKKSGIDLLSVSGHKIHGPKGSGFLYVKEKTKIKPIIYGGGQQNGMRSGTENVPGIAGLGEAAAEIYEDFKEKQDRLYALKERFIREVTTIPGVSVNGKTGRDSAPHIVSVSVEGVRAEVLLHSLEDKQIYVSSGSACSSNKPAVSRTLKGIGLKQNLLDSTVRFSFSVHTTEEEIDYAADVLKTLVPALQKYTRH